MAKLEIIIAPNPLLKRKACPVGYVDARISKLMEDMQETMYVASGIGLAAPQVGILERIIVIDVFHKDGKRQSLQMVNPEITWASDEDLTYQEGCLSIPEQFADITRPASVRVRYTDYHNQSRELLADGLLATCIQHEIDHLDGVLFVDRLSKLRRNVIMRKLAKWKKARMNT